MSAVYANAAAAAPTLGPVGVPDRPDDRARLLARVRLASALPALVCLGVHVVFGVSWWIPETSAVPAHDWWLTQLAPLASRGLTSAGTAQVAVQQSQVGIGGELLLVSAVVLLLLARHPRRLGQAAVLVPAAFGAVVALVVLAALLVGGLAGRSQLAILLLVLWVVSAGYAALHSLVLDLGAARPRRWRNGLGLLGAYAVLGPAPTAVGRALAGGSLRGMAASLQQNVVGYRLAALTSGSTVLCYLTGLLAGVTVWALYQCWPPRRDLRSAGRLSLTLLVLVTTFVLGVGTAEVSRVEARHLELDSPTATARAGCGHVLVGAATSDPAPSPARTVVASGPSCRTVASYAGYHEQGSSTLSFSLAPVTVRGTDGARLSGRPVGAQYGQVLVLVGTTRLDRSADQVVALRVQDASVLWQYTCSARPSLRLRFARVPGGDDDARGYRTRNDRRPLVVATCGGRTVRLDPATGLGSS